MGRREVDPRPEVEVLGSGSPAPPTQRVELHARRPARRARGAALVAAVAAVLAIGFAVDGSDGGSSPDDPGGEARVTGSSTTAPPRTTTTPVTRAGSGPVFETATGGARLVLGTLTTRWAWIDLDTGERGSVEVNGLDGQIGVPVRGGMVALTAGGATFRPVPEGPGVPLGPADHVVASGDPGTVWLLTAPADGAGDWTARSVDLAGVERAVVSVPASFVPGGTETGVLFTTGGRVYHATPDGVRPVATGELVGSTADQAVVLVCDDRAECALERIDVLTGHSLRYEDLLDPFRNGFLTVPGPRGEMAVVVQGPSEPTLVWYDSTGRRVGSVELPPSAGAPVWLPRGLGLLVPSGRGLQRVRGGEAGLVVESVDPLADVVVEAPYVISP